jgi:hypothetical protein
MLAVCGVEAMCFPIDDMPALVKLSEEFARDTGGLLAGCVGAVDGLAVRIKKPTLKDCKNPKAYYNRKGFFSMNLQAVCDKSRRFMFGSLRCAGSTHDSTAWAVSQLGSLIADKKLPANHWIAGDDAYGCSNSLLTPYPGRGLSPPQDTFNYHLSLQRCSIECAFGILVARWGILWRPLSVPLHRVHLVVLTCMKLHNICINARLNLNGGALPADMGWGAAPEFTATPSDQCSTVGAANGHNNNREKVLRRKQLANALHDAGYKRPPHSCGAK